MMDVLASGGGRPPLIAPDEGETPVGNPLGIYGRIERMRIGSSLIRRRPTEVTACKHILRPDDPDFVPTPREASHLRCHGCRKMKLPHEFHIDARNRLRQGRETSCKVCRKIERRNARKRRFTV